MTSTIIYLGWQPKLYRCHLPTIKAKTQVTFKNSKNGYSCINDKNMMLNYALKKTNISYLYLATLLNDVI